METLTILLFGSGVLVVTGMVGNMEQGVATPWGVIIFAVICFAGGIVTKTISVHMKEKKRQQQRELRRRKARKANINYNQKVG